MITAQGDFRRRDQNGAVRVHARPGIVPFDRGDTVTLTVTGIVDRDFVRPEGQARTAARPDGNRVTFHHCGA